MWPCRSVGFLKQTTLFVGAAGVGFLGRYGYNEKLKYAVGYVSPGTILPLTVHHGSLP